MSEASKHTKPPVEPEKRVCRNCGKEFVTTNRKQVYCTKECQNDAANARDRARRHQDPRPCAFCGKTFQPVRTSHICCSHECSNGYHNRLRKERRKETYKPTIYTKVCPNCGKEFATTTYLRKACSEECAKAIMRRQNQAAYLAQNPQAGLRIRANSASQKSVRRVRITRDKHGLTPAERRAVIEAQNGPREELWRVSQSWTPAQRKFAKRRYEAMHPFNHANAGWY